MFTVGAFSQFDPPAGPLYQLSVLLAEVIAISVLNIELIGLHYRWFLFRFIFVAIFNILRIYILTSWEGIDSLVTMYIVPGFLRLVPESLRLVPESLHLARESSSLVPDH